VDDLIGTIHREKNRAKRNPLASTALVYSPLLMNLREKNLLLEYLSEKQFAPTAEKAGSMTDSGMMNMREPS
jgi:hypothetical protein